LTNVLDLGAVDQLLSLQHPAEQQADDDEYNGNLYEGKARLQLASAGSCHSPVTVEYGGGFKARFVPGLVPPKSR
jgi:hypothetical protein